MRPLERMLKSEQIKAEAARLNAEIHEKEASLKRLQCDAGEHYRDVQKRIQIFRDEHGLRVRAEKEAANKSALEAYNKAVFQVKGLLDSKTGLTFAAWDA